MVLYFNKFTSARTQQLLAQAGKNEFPSWNESLVEVADPIQKAEDAFNQYREDAPDLCRLELLAEFKQMKQEAVGEGYKEEDHYISSEDELEEHEHDFMDQSCQDGGWVDPKDLTRIHPKVYEAFKVSSTPDRLRLLSAMWQHLEDVAPRACTWEVLECLAKTDCRDADLIWWLICEGRQAVLRTLCKIVETRLKIAPFDEEAQERTNLPRSHAEIEQEAGIAVQLMSHVLPNDDAKAEEKKKQET